MRAWSPLNAPPPHNNNKQEHVSHIIKPIPKSATLPSSHIVGPIWVLEILDIVVASGYDQQHDSSHTLSKQRVDSIVAAAIRSAAQLIWMGEVCAESSVTKHRIWPNKIPVLHVAPYTQHLCSSGCLRGAHFDHWNTILFSYLLHNLKRFPTDGAFNYHYNRTFVDQDDMAIHFETRGSMLQALVPPGSRVAELGVLVCHILLTLTHSLPQRS